MIGEISDVQAWFFTYAVHSSVLLAGAWLLSCLLRGRHVTAREWLWRGAMFGGLITATYQVSAPTDADISSASAPSQLSGISTESEVPLDVRAHAPVPVIPPSHPRASTPTPGPLQDESLGIPNLPMVVWFLVLSGALALLRQVARYVRLWLLLKPRQAVEELELRRELREVCAALGFPRHVRLSRSAVVRTPVAFGLVRPEVCLPLGQADAISLRGMLSHEVSHLRRRDPAWLSAASLLVSAFWWQPLLRLAERRIQELSELQSDAGAVRVVGAIPFARCLVEIAEGLSSRTGPFAPSPLCAMAHRRSGLAHRVDRLLNPPAKASTLRERALVFVLVPGILIAAALWAPRVAVADAPKSLDSARLDSVPTPTVERPEPRVGPEAELLELLDAEWALLLQEVDLLRDDLASVETDDALRRLLTLLDQKLSTFDQRRQALHALVSKQFSPSDLRDQPAEGPKK